jgi:GrpB-like predicted nucleotidyltransferase (UPF0157 family)
MGKKVGPENTSSFVSPFAERKESMKNLITIVPSGPQGPLEFRRIGMPLREALGDLAVRSDHIGSTAVPGLAAKDVIDVQVTVATLMRASWYEHSHRSDTPFGRA